MQVQFSLDPTLRREEFVERALLFPPVITLDVEPHQLSLPAREALAQCHPDLPEIYTLRAPGEADGSEILWKLPVNPNAYAPAEIVEMWAKDYHDAGRGQRADTADENPFDDAASINAAANGNDAPNNNGAAKGNVANNGVANGAATGAANGENEDDWAKDVFDF